MRQPDSTQNNAAEIGRREDQELDRADAAEQQARVGEPIAKTVAELVFQLFVGNIETPGELHEAIYKLGYAEGYAQRQKEFDEWLAKRQSEDSMAADLLDGATWKRRHEVT